MVDKEVGEERCQQCGNPIGKALRGLCANCLLQIGVTDLSGGAKSVAAPDAPTLRDDAGARNVSSVVESWSEGQFLPGVVLGGRYRIVSLIGRGGMGEVYRAEDLKLCQPVALKFLPAAIDEDESRRTALYNEVRQARRVTHPNVCRVHDIGEMEGRHFLSMEFIDGENLGALLKRIGRLPRDKAAQLARQLCAALAAAHRGGVLHRDLKPANLMIDGSGNLRITDFGLAQLGTETGGNEKRIAGTPAYMAPEQLTEGRFSKRSDIYSLGLVLYEMFTGKRVNESSEVAEIVRKNLSEVALEKPSSTVEQLDPIIDEIILRCLEKDPAQRPASVEEVMVKLPGAVDLLDEALAAGVTPAPAVVAAAGSSGALKQSTGIVLLAAALVVLFAAMFVVPRARLFGQTDFGKRPEVLADKARGILHGLGYEEPRDTRYGFAVEKPGAAPQSKESVYFWYREAQAPLFSKSGLARLVAEDDPPLTVPGMINLRLDLNGRLIRFQVAPAGWLSERSRPPGDPERDPAPWRILAEAAQLPAATREAMQGAEKDGLRRDSFPVGGEESPSTVSLVTSNAMPVFFERSRGDSAGQSAAVDVSMHWLRIVVGIAALFLGVYHWRTGKADLRGAACVALFAGGLAALLWTLTNGLAGFQGRPDVAYRGLQAIFSIIASSAFYYVALEPILRRLWPQTLISWSRLLAGNLRNPLVGRGILVGILAGAAASLLIHLGVLAPNWLSAGTAGPLAATDWEVLASRWGWISVILDQAQRALLYGFGTGLVIVLFVAVVRSRRLAAGIATIAIAIVGPYHNHTGHVLTTAFALAAIGILVVILLRHGVLALIVGIWVVFLFEKLPITHAVTQWYASPGLITLVCVLALACYAFAIATPTRGLLGRLLLEQKGTQPSPRDTIR